MSDYKMVPVVATHDMREAGAKSIPCDLSGPRWQHETLTRAARNAYVSMLAKAPPFVVTDEVVEAAYRAFAKVSAETGSEWSAMRAAIEAVLGGGK